MQRWKPSGARLNARPWKEANNGPRIAFDGSYSNSSKRLITGAGSTALWGINHLWTSNKTTTKNGKDRVKYCDHKKGGRESISLSRSGWVTRRQIGYCNGDWRCHLSFHSRK